MRPRLACEEPSAQIDAFAAPTAGPQVGGWAEPANANSPSARKHVGLRGLSRTYGVHPVPQALWLGLHLPQLQSLDERGSRKVLERLATGAQQFTPKVSLAPPDGLVLEVKGSVNLFGGVERLRCAVAGLHQATGLQAVLAFAPTPLAALVRARAQQTQAVIHRAHLTGSLASLRLGHLRWPPKALERLAKIGVYTIGQALRLPRDGFARRFGVEQLASLDRLTGRIADPQLPFHPRECFRRRRDFGFELEDQALIVKALEPLLQELQKFLRSRQRGIVWLECRLVHPRSPPTLCLLRLASPCADARRLGALLGEKLRTLMLPEPIRSCELRTSSIVEHRFFSSALWQPGELGGEVGRAPGELIEFLRARLGDEAVQGLQLVHDHRPEKQSAAIQALPHHTEQGTRPLLSREAGESVDGRARQTPLWLLAIPRLLSDCSGLHLAGRPRRVEAGWWDGEDVGRDYFVAFDTHGVRLWIFRERNKPHRWFLQGMFG